MHWELLDLGVLFLKLLLLHGLVGEKLSQLFLGDNDPQSFYIRPMQ